MSSTENQDYSEASTPSPDTPSGPEAPSGPSMEGVGSGLEGDYDERIEVIGGIHETDLSEYSEALDQKYSGEEGPDAFLATGDYFTNSLIRKGVDDTPEQDLEVLENNLSKLNEFGEKYDAPVILNKGNHEPIEGAHPGNEEAVNKYEEIYQEKHGEVEDDIFGSIVSELENLEDLEYGTTQIGDKTVIGGSHFFEPEPDPGTIPDPEPSEIYDEEELDEIADILSEEKSHDYGLLGSMPLVGGLYKKAANFLFSDEFLGNENFEASELSLEDIEELPEEAYEELVSEEHESYNHQIEQISEKYEGKKQKYEELFEEAGDEIILLDHFTFDTEGKSDIDKLRGEHKGSPAVRDVVKEYSDEKDITTFFGHAHGGGHDEVFGVDMYNVGEGQYIEAGFTDDGLETNRYGSPTKDQSDEELSEEDMAQVEQTLEAMDESEDFESFWGKQEEKIEENLGDQLGQEEIEKTKKAARAQSKQFWENKDEIEANIQQQPNPASA